MLNIKQKLFLRKIKKSLINKWYKLVEPLGNYLNKRDDEKYKKLKESITEEQAAKWIAKSIINYIVRYPNEEFPLVIATWIDKDYYSAHYCMGSSSFSRIIKKRKYKTAYYKFNNRDLEFQEKVVNGIKSTKGLVIREEVEKFSYRKPDNYLKTYFIEVQK